MLVMKNIRAIYHQIFHKTRAADMPSSASAPTTQMAMARKMMEMITHTEEVELTCDKVFDLLDQFTEMALKGEDVARLMPMVEHHLEMCPECREEYEALRRIVELGFVT
jgi:hypothetical protein